MNRSTSQHFWSAKRSPWRMSFFLFSITRCQSRFFGMNCGPFNYQKITTVYNIFVLEHFNNWCIAPMVNLQQRSSKSVFGLSWWDLQPLKLIFQPSIFRCELFVSGRVYRYIHLLHPPFLHLFAPKIPWFQTINTTVSHPAIRKFSAKTHRPIRGYRLFRGGIYGYPIAQEI